MTWRSRRLGLALGAIHLGLVLLVAVSIFRGEDPVAWLIFLFLDFPVSLIWAALSVVGAKSLGAASVSIGSDVWNFLVPLGFLSTVGTAWWYAVGLRIHRWRSARQPGESFWSQNLF